MALRSRRTGVLSVQGRQALISNLFAFDHATRENYRVVVRRMAQETRDLSVQLAPKSTGYMARNIKFELTPDEMEFSVFLDPDDFTGNGLPFYPLYVHQGAAGRSAQPFLQEALAEMEPFFLTDLRSATKRAQRAMRRQ